MRDRFSLLALRKQAVILLLLSTQLVFLSTSPNVCSASVLEGVTSLSSSSSAFIIGFPQHSASRTQRGAFIKDDVCKHPSTRRGSNNGRKKLFDRRRRRYTTFQLHMVGGTDNRKSIDIDTGSKRSSPNGSSSKDLVLMSHVVRHVPLNVLMYYLRSNFQLPTNLPMPFVDDDEIDDGNETSNIVRSWSCPAAAASSSGRLVVEVVGIRVKPEDIIPIMAMVAVKTTTSSEQSPSPLDQLIKGTQQQICHLLERNLDELSTNPSKQRQLEYDMIQQQEQQQQQKEQRTNQSNNKNNSEEQTITTTTKQKKLTIQDATIVSSSSSSTTAIANSKQDSTTINGKTEASPNKGKANTNEEQEEITDISQLLPNKTKQNNKENEELSATSTISDICQLLPTKQEQKKKKKQSMEDSEPVQTRKTSSSTTQNESSSSPPKQDVDFMTDGEDLSNEELAQRVLEFHEKEKEEEGNVFATTAFDTAKQLLHRQNDDIKAEVGVKEHDNSLQDELRAMFARGQAIADDKKANMELATTTFSDMESNGSSRQKAEATVVNDNDNRNGNSPSLGLDEELAELEVRLDAFSSEDGNVFDLFEGPPSDSFEQEDPLTSMNYPGAGTIDGTFRRKTSIKLPSKLKEAVDQATFAAKTLMELEQSEQDGRYVSTKTGQVLTEKQIHLLQTTVERAVRTGIIDDPLTIMSEQSRFDVLIKELLQTSEERFSTIIQDYKDVLLSDHFVIMIKQRLENMKQRQQQKRNSNENKEDDDNDDIKERQILQQLVQSSMLILKECQSVGKELEAMQLEIIRSICSVAMDPNHLTEEEAAVALSDAVRDMKPLLDDTFVSYLKYAIQEETSRLSRRGLLDDPDHSTWLHVLTIIQQGVYAELSKTLRRHVDSIHLVLRMTTAKQRRKLLELLVADLPTLDVRSFRLVVDNIVGATLGGYVKGEFSDQLDNSYIVPMLQLSKDIDDVLSPDIIAHKAKDADLFIEKQRERLLKMRDEKRQYVLNKTQQSQTQQLQGSGDSNNDYEEEENDETLTP